MNDGTVKYENYRCSGKGMKNKRTSKIARRRQCERDGRIAATKETLRQSYKSSEHLDAIPLDYIR